METRGSIRFLYGANRNSAPPIVGLGPQEGCPLPMSRERVGYQAWPIGASTPPVISE
jgi:hypothetical protein